jgi:DNA-directed RNA polymerase specialized sigma24 family protein
MLSDSESADPNSIAHWREQYHIARERLAALTVAKTAEAVALAAQGMSQAEVARKTGLTVATAQKIISRAKRAQKVTAA